MEPDRVLIRHTDLGLDPPKAAEPARLDEGVGRDMSSARRESSPYHYWNEPKADDVQGYQ